MIEPYGGRLVDRTVTHAQADDLRSEASSLPAATLGEASLSDLFLIAVGGLSPLEGFLDQAAYESVVNQGRLPMGLPWTIPIVLPVRNDEWEGAAVGDRVALVAPDGTVAAILDVTDRFERDVEREADMVYGTRDRAHPGVAALYSAGARCLAGPIHYLYPEDISGFPGENLTPVETRNHFEERGWETVVAFQTRNPIHRAHEYLQKCALEIADGLLLHPLVGETKPDDVPADIRMECYRTILKHYYPQDRVILSVLPAAMRYAGPREAIHHAIMRRNYGCTHFIVGRDHAGVGSYYGTYDAQRIFDTLEPNSLGIEPLKFEHSFFCTSCGQMGSSKSCPHGQESHVFLSGTRVRELLAQGADLPVEFTRPEVADVLRKAYAAPEPAAGRPS